MEEETQAESRRESSGRHLAGSRDTKMLILDTAEQMFADHGLAATSLRSIIAKAQVNLAAVHYHFGSKAGLVEAVLMRRLEPINRQRLEALDRLEDRGDAAPPMVEEIIDAFIGPPLRWNGIEGDRAVLMRLMGRLLNENAEVPAQVLSSLFATVRDRFLRALVRALPHLDGDDLQWRFHFMIGTMIHTMVFADRLAVVSLGPGCAPSAEADLLIDRLTPFLAAGLSARPTYDRRGR